MNKFEEYDASYLSKQGTLLKKFEGIRKYLLKNPTINIYLCNENYEENLNYYPLSSLKNGDHEVKSFDMVIFKNGVGAIIDSIGGVNFLIIDAFNFGIVGPQGPQGIPGETGPQGIPGETGKTALLVTTIKSFSPTGQNVNVQFNEFNRIPLVTEKFYCITTYNDLTYIVLMQVTAIDNETAICRKLSNRQLTGPQGIQGETGPQGPAGQTTLYKHTLTLSENSTETEYPAVIITTNPNSFVNFTGQQLFNELLLNNHISFIFDNIRTVVDFAQNIYQGQYLLQIGIMSYTNIQHKDINAVVSDTVTAL